MRTIVPMDFDMDGDIDMIMDNHDASRIDWMTNDGKGNFSSVKQLLKPKINQLSFFVVDFDDDGRR
ncbi:MAG: VCBS repeat-containing protein [Saprospiraceae bacterium]|nr:VCBS repeat-containing protein [Saprospiraceae bacterium]